MALDLSPDYASRLLRMFNKLFTVADSHKVELDARDLCGQLSKLGNVPPVPSRMKAWMKYLVTGIFQVCLDFTIFFN